MVLSLPLSLSVSLLLDLTNYFRKTRIKNGKGHLAFSVQFPKLDSQEPESMGLRRDSQRGSEKGFSGPWISLFWS